ncbi:MAG: 50S ribosomal protein L4 [Clostridia bacterium]|nr:50S ribosomal protein L4 [Clostridia bacterium]
MPIVNLYNMNAEVIGEINLADEIFGSDKINDTVIHQVMKMQLANKRQGTQSTLTRTEVSGGGKKPYRQKGTGRARQGSTRAPQWRHGGVVFAPKPRDYSFSVPKKVKRLALKGTLASKVCENTIKVIDSISVEEFKTKVIAGMLAKFELTGKKTMLLIKENDEKLVKSARNIPGLIVSFVGSLNVVDLLNYDNVIVSKAAIEMIEEVYR